MDDIEHDDVDPLDDWGLEGEADGDTGGLAEGGVLHVDEAAGDDAMGAAGATDDPVPEADLSTLFPKAPAQTRPVVVAVLSQIDVGMPLDLRKIAAVLRNVEFVSGRTTTASMRLREPSGVATIRSSGSISLVGSVSVSAAKQGAELCVRLIRHALQLKHLQSFRFRVRSMMARFNLCHPIRLDEIQRALPKLASYEPETFCACILKLQGGREHRWNVSCSVFVTGKVTMVGASCDADIKNAFNTLLPLIAPFAAR